MLIYTIPSSSMNMYLNKTVTVRSDNAPALVEAFSTVPRDNLWSLQVISMDCDADALLHLSDQAPIDLVIDNPTKEFSRLYRFAELTRKHPVRVTVRAVPGMTKAVKVAQALNFSVKLELGQPEPSVARELVALAEYYLRGSSVSSPVEPFHSLFLSFLSGKPTSLWSLQEEDPAVDRYITDDGKVTFSKRLGALGIPENQFVSFLEQHMSRCLEAEECDSCEFFSRCRGFFKLPDKGYQCDRVKRLLALLNDAAMEMRRDEQRFVGLYGPETTALVSSPSLGASTAIAPFASAAVGSLETLKATGATQDVLSSFSMQRINYRLAEFTRFSWANDEARTVWEPRIRNVGDCLNELEWRSILEGVRACALTSVAPDQLESFAAMLANNGLTMVSLEKVAVQDLYANSFKRPQEGEPFHYWCAIGRASDVHLFESAYSRHDDGAIGRLLGYPSCCIDFFNRVWVNEGFVDTTWPMAQNTANKRVISPTHLEIEEASSGNQLLRWLGMRVAIHLPCSFDCQPTVELAKKLTGVARSAGFHQEMDWLEEMLSWPIEWTALNGHLEITTPVGTIFSVTDATAETYRVSYKGTGHANPHSRKVSFPDDAPGKPFQDQEWYYTDNGFSSGHGMDLCHEPIAKLATQTLADANGNVLDLGCGNGVLVKKICQSNSKLIPWGVDISKDNIAHARQLDPGFSDNFLVSDIFNDWEVWSKDREFELVILSLVRLTEVPQEQAEGLLKRIREHGRKLLVYAYDGDGSLEELAGKSGITLSNKGSHGNVALADLGKL